MLLLGSSAALALLLAMVGIYGVISYSVTQRTHEIGIRVALGAGQRDVAKLIVGRTLALAAIGVGIGLAVAFGATRLISGLLFGSTATDTFSVVPFIMIGVALLASYIPSRRASKIDPMPFPEIEKALAGIQAVAPGRRGQEPVRSVIFPRINLK